MLGISLVVATLLLALASTIFLRTPTMNASALEINGKIGVYWDKACTTKVNSIGWGVLKPDQTKAISVYVRNEGSESIFLSENAANWYPSSAQQYLAFSWHSLGKRIDVGKIINVAQTLQVFSNVTSLPSFRFDIVFRTMKYILGDIDGDGTVNLLDSYLAALAYGSAPGDPNWNPDADLDANNYVNMVDLYTVSTNFGKT